MVAYLILVQRIVVRAHAGKQKARTDNSGGFLFLTQALYQQNID